MAEARTQDWFVRQVESLVTGGQAVTELAGAQVVVIRRGKVAFSHAAGMAHQTSVGHKTPLTLEHKVRVASISKFVMALGFMKLVEQGRVDLDRNVSDYLGFELLNPYFPDQPITSRQLLSHTSSIRDGGMYFLPYGEDFKSLFILDDDNPHFANTKGQEPGKYFTYANLNFGILAGVIEKVTGQRFDRYMEQQLFQPLGLNISFNSCQFKNTDHDYLATLYRRGMGGDLWQPEGPWVAQVDDTSRRCYYGGPEVPDTVTAPLIELDDYQPGSNPTLFSPQGGLRASAMDLAELLLMLMKETDLSADNHQPVLGRDTIQQMLTPQWQYQPELNNGYTGGEITVSNHVMGLQTAYGLSTHILNLKDWHLTGSDSIWYGHMASAYGLLGQLWFNPQTNDGMVILLTGMGDDPTKPKKTTPMEEVEAQFMRLALDALSRD